MRLAPISLVGNRVAAESQNLGRSNRLAERCRCCKDEAMLTASMETVAIGLMLTGHRGPGTAGRSQRSADHLVRLGNGAARPFPDGPMPAPRRPWPTATLVVSVPIVGGLTKFTRRRSRSSADANQPRQARYLRHPRGRPSRTRLENFQPTAAPKSSGLASRPPR